MKIVFKKIFLKEIEKIKDQKLKDQVFNSILNTESAATLKQIRNLKRLKGFSKHYRIRLGDYRIGLIIENNIAYFASFNHRKDIYRKFP